MSSNSAQPRYDFRLAEEVITEAFANHFDPNRGADFEAVIWDRWPATKGGVGFDHARTRKIVRESIREFYAPADYWPEPDFGALVG